MASRARPDADLSIGFGLASSNAVRCPAQPDSALDCDRSALQRASSCEDRDVARNIRLEGCFNLRDLGGHESTDGRRVRAGCLFRSDELHALTAGDLEVLS